MNGKMKSCIKGLMMGICGKPLPLSTAKKEPIAYSYNGVVLPKLPEWDKEKYPYAYISEKITFGAAVYHCFYVTQCPPAIVKSTGETKYSLEGYAGHFVYSIFISGDLEWKEPNFYTVLNGHHPAWTNTDIYYEDGVTLYLKASDPIPVYE